MSSKMTLDVAAMTEDFFHDTALIGIVCPLPGYRFCWLVNQKLDMQFVRDPQSDIIVIDNSNQEHFFPIYKYITQNQGLNYWIYKLKSDQECLLPEVKQLDYLWMMQSNSPEADAALLIQHMREIPEIQLAQVILPDKLKNLNNLLV